MTIKQRYCDSLCRNFGVQKWVAPILAEMLDYQNDGVLQLTNEARLAICGKLKINRNTVSQALHRLKRAELLLAGNKIDTELFPPIEWDKLDMMEVVIAIDKDGETIYLGSAE